MNYTEAYEHLKQRKMLTRDEWDKTGEFVILLPGMQYIWKIIFIPNPSCGNWLPLRQDLDATDWKFVDDNLIAPKMDT